ncbi:uroporphyrinogen decarboxylase family protein [Aggregatilinea lenta]|uniref:uroporphyrinogen decarboxylase family protein n=1 Tax=Aggregatilinea lenta TaxID=913108 RepID=UPI000E5BAA84|nr:uroporphyrinogen decarboxylase family protein [Aggregatilinea lenta]
MNSRERIKTSLAFREPDRIGKGDAYWEDTLTRWHDEGLPVDADVKDVFGFDIEPIFMDASLRLPEMLLEDTDEYTIRQDKIGYTAKQWKGRSGALGYLNHVIETSADWDRLKGRLAVDFGGTSRIHTVSYFEPFVQYPTWAEMGATFRHLLIKERYILLHVYGPWEATWRKHGFDTSLMTLALEPEFIADMCETHVDLVIATLDRAQAEGIVPDGLFMVEDLGMSTGMMFSPRMYERVIYPAHKRLGDALRQRGITYFMHSDGDIRTVIPRLIDAGVQVLQPLEAKSRMDVRTLKAEYGHDLVFFGNIDVRMMSASRAELEEEVRTKLAAVMPGGGYIYHSDHSVPPTVSFENYCFLMDLLSRYGSY